MIPPSANSLESRSKSLALCWICSCLFYCTYSLKMMYTLLSLAGDKTHIVLCPLVISTNSQHLEPAGNYYRKSSKTEWLTEHHKYHDSKYLGKAISIWAVQKSPLWGGEIWAKRWWVRNWVWERQRKGFPRGGTACTRYWGGRERRLPYLRNSEKAGVINWRGKFMWGEHGAVWCLQHKEALLRHAAKCSGNQVIAWHYLIQGFKRKNSLAAV